MGLWEMKEYRNFPFRWSGAVGVWEKDGDARARIPGPVSVARSQGRQGVLRGAVLRREEGGLPRTEHQRRRLRLPRLRPVLHLLALVLLPLCAGLPGVQPAGGASA